QRCTVHKHRNLLAHAPERLHDEVTADYTDMIYAATPEEIEQRRKAFIRKWRLRHRPIADCLEQAGDRLFTFTRLPPRQGRSARTTNAIERLHEEFKRRIKTQTVLPSAETAACCSGRCSPLVRSTCARLMVGRPSPQSPSISRLTSPPDQILSKCRRSRHQIPTPLATAPALGAVPQKLALSPCAEFEPRVCGGPFLVSRTGRANRGIGRREKASAQPG